jgi:hypothetical protein
MGRQPEGAQAQCPAGDLLFTKSFRLYSEKKVVEDGKADGPVGSPEER